jgi:hypothetical protein
MNATNTTEGTIAVAASELAQWGCPYCGYRSGYTPISGGGAAVWSCGSCHQSCIILDDDLTVSPIGVGGEYPTLQDHPRRGTPSHGTPDTPPAEGGEFFRSRGIGLESRLSCFACGREEYMLHNIAAFVQTKESGERIVALFTAVNGGARLDYRDHEPDRVQAKVGACDDHQSNLIALDKLCRDGRITAERISASL